MLNVGFGEIIVIALVLLMVVGPEQLPGVIRRVGQVVGQAKSMTDSLRSEFMSGLDEIERAADVESWARDSEDLRSDDKRTGGNTGPKTSADVSAGTTSSDGQVTGGSDDQPDDDGGGLPKSAPIAVPAPFSGSSSADPAVRTNGSPSDDSADEPRSETLDQVTGDDIVDEDLFADLDDEQRALLDDDAGDDGRMEESA